MKTQNLKLWWLVGAITMIVMTSTVFAQGSVDSLTRDDDRIITSIAPYPSDMRNAILDVSQYPQALVKLERVQGRTSQSFQDLIADYPHDEQEKFYQIARFPYLINRLVEGGQKKNNEAIDALLKDYPESVQQQVRSLYTSHYNDLEKMNHIYNSSQSALDRITAKFPKLVADDFKKVVQNPDVMNLLTDNIDLTVSLGEAYKADPSGVTSQLGDLNRQLTEQNARDLADYKQAVEKDPKLQAEMKKAADEFARQYDQEDSSPTYVTNNIYDNYPYQYWFGYPYWYSSAMWYPAPFYYQTGFYYAPGGGLVIAGFPSLFYANWFFGYGYHRYPGLYNHYNTYYNVHRYDIVNRNISRSYSRTTRNQFSATGRTSLKPGSTQTVTRRSVLMHNRNTANRVRYNTHLSQMNVRPGNFNGNGYSHYNANTFHGSGWQGVHGGFTHSMHGAMSHGRR